MNIQSFLAISLQKLDLIYEVSKVHATLHFSIWRTNLMLTFLWTFWKKIPQIGVLCTVKRGFWIKLMLWKVSSVGLSHISGSHKSCFDWNFVLLARKSVKIKSLFTQLILFSTKPYLMSNQVSLIFMRAKSPIWSFFSVLLGSHLAFPEF